MWQLYIRLNNMFGFKILFFKVFSFSTAYRASELFSVQTNLKSIYIRYYTNFSSPKMLSMGIL